MTTNVLSAYGEKIYEGKAKIVFRTPENELVHYFKDSATAFNAQKKGEFLGKGELNLSISSLLFKYLKGRGILSHFVSELDARTFKTQELKMFPVEVVVRNKVAGSLAKRLGLVEGKDLNPPVVEFFLKDDAKGDPLVSEDLLASLFGQSRADLEQMKNYALKINFELSSLFARGGLILADFKLEFGRASNGQILLADEISPDTCRFWDSKTGEKWDKDRFRFDLGDLLVGYRVVLERLQIALQSAEGQVAAVE